MASGGTLPDKQILDGAIGLIRETKVDDPQFKMKVIAYLVDLKDGIQNTSTEVYTQKAVDMANLAVDHITDLTTKSKETLDSGLIKQLVGYIREGAQITKASIETVGSVTKVTLGN